MRVVEHVRRHGALVVLAHRHDVLPGVAEHVNGFAAYRQEDIHRRILSRTPGVDEPLVRIEIEAPAQPVGEQRQGEEQRGQQHARAVHPEPVVLQHQPDLAEQQQREAGHREKGQDPRVLPDIPELLTVIRRHRQDRARPLWLGRCLGGGRGLVSQRWHARDDPQHAGPAGLNLIGWRGVGPHYVRGHRPRPGNVPGSLGGHGLRCSGGFRVVSRRRLRSGGCRGRNCGTYRAARPDRRANR